VRDELVVSNIAGNMALNDGDTSDDESSSYTSINVLLGYASKEPTDDTFSQLGGLPVRPDKLQYEMPQLKSNKTDRAG